MPHKVTCGKVQGSKSPVDISSVDMSMARKRQFLLGAKVCWISVSKKPCFSDVGKRLGKAALPTGCVQTVPLGTVLAGVLP